MNRISSEEIDELKEAFDLFDIDNLGILEPQEIIKTMRSLRN
jgi:Ca2+-binding EF-hand superfamily protein